MHYYLVAVDTPFNNSLLTYASQVELSIGTFVEVPLRTRKAKGCIFKTIEESKALSEAPKTGFKEISSQLTFGFSLKSEQLNFYEWVARYYQYPLGQLIFDTIPKEAKRKKIKPQKLEGSRLNYIPTKEQQEVIDGISVKLNSGFQSWLIHGVTGSGKSVIYLDLVQRVLKSGKNVLFILPEINLTPQFVSFFQNQVDCPVHLYHSELANGERFSLWQELGEEQAVATSPRLIIGVRSAVFLPIHNLGLIVVDEEHDGSLKQDDRCPYNARDLALMHSSLLGITTVLGSATPSLESYHLFKSKGSYFKLTKRVNDSVLPDVELVDLKSEITNNKHDFDERIRQIWPLTDSTIAKMRHHLSLNEQILVFVSRLGYASYLQCSDCGHRFTCPNCTNNLRYYESRREVKCHICGYSERMPESCPVCFNLKILQKGFGTEKLQELLKKEFPTKVVKRFDRDEITTFKKLKDRLEEFHDGTVDILVGTQMLSKGHNFEKVNLVVVLGVDSQINFPDLRAAEKTYQLLTQVAGRGGRFGKKGRVLIHTLNPDNNIYRYLDGKCDPELFYKDELSIRDMIGTPPFGRLAMIYLTSNFRERCIEASEKSANFLRSLTEREFKEVEVMGPRPSIIEKRVNKFTWCLMLKSADRNQLHNLLHNLKNGLEIPQGVTLKIDRDPYTMM